MDSMLNDELIIERVKAGAEWLDTHYKGWFEDLDLERLDLSSCVTCVLGQLGPGLFWRELDQHKMSGEVDYFDVLSKIINPMLVTDDDDVIDTINVESSWSAEHGFTVELDCEVDVAVKAFAKLESTWAALVSKRLVDSEWTFPKLMEPRPELVNPTNDPHYFTHRRGE